MTTVIIEVQDKDKEWYEFAVIELPTEYRGVRAIVKQEFMESRKLMELTLQEMQQKVKEIDNKV